MNEQFLHYIWKNSLFGKENLLTENNETVSIISPGIRNSDAGPDFLNARIKIGDTLWAGNVEVHVDAKAWFEHKHHLDKAYDNVILHVVEYTNEETYRTNGEEVPVLKLKYDKKIADRYSDLVADTRTIACQNEIRKIDSFRINHWLENLTIERLMYQTEPVSQILKYTKNNWEETLYISIARSFGLRINVLPFELLAKSLPLKILVKHQNNLTQLEALLFGQAGFLETSPEDDYIEFLKKEYSYLKKTYQLNSIEKHLWKFLRLRPLNFPTIRLAQFAVMIHKTQKLFSQIQENLNPVYLHELLSHDVSDYWKNHYQPGKISTCMSKKLGHLTVNNIVINSVVPVFFQYSKATGNDNLRQEILDLLYYLPPEKNKIINEWINLGLELQNAAQTQASIQLRNFYCIKKNCLNCQIGNYLITETEVK